MENKVYYGEYSLSYWIELMLKKNIELPEYQRYFVWKEEDMDILLESFKEKQFVPPVTIGVFNDDTGNHNYIIDGQQRLTCVLLAFLERFPLKEAGNQMVERQALANENDDEEDDDEEDVDDMIEWTFKVLTDKGKTKESIISKCSPEQYKSLVLELPDEFFSKTYLVFSYLVPEEADTASQTRYFSTVFRNINIHGKSLYTLESRESLYFLDSTLRAWFNPNFTKDISSSVVDRSMKPRMDFVRYLSLLSQYNKNGNRNRVAYGYAKKIETYYESYIYSVINDEENPLFGKFSDLYTDKDYEGQLDRLEILIDEFDMRKRYPSIIDMDLYFFGLIYFILIEKKELDITRKEDLTQALQRKITVLKKDSKHTKTPSLLKYLNERINSSVSIYRRYIIP